MVMLIPILILVSSVLFVFGFLNLNFLNTTKKFLSHGKNPLVSSPPTSLEPTSSPIEDKKANKIITKGEDDDLKRVFDTFDKNGDGFITREELKESLSNMGIVVVGEDIEEMVEKLDSNKDGLVDVSEFRELYELVKGKEEKKNGGKEVCNGDDDDESDLKEAFKVFDDNNDGLITVKELGLVLSSLGLKEGKREEDCIEMIKKVDVDGDGMVNYEEFKMMMRANWSKSSKLVNAL